MIGKKMIMNRSRMKVQELAILALSNTGEAIYHKATYDTQPKVNGKYPKGTHTFYKVSEQYHILPRPRLEPRACKCCASCKFKKINVKGERICSLKKTHKKVDAKQLCERYQMSDIMKRI